MPFCLHYFSRVMQLTSTLPLPSSTKNTMQRCSCNASHTPCRLSSQHRCAGCILVYALLWSLHLCNSKRSWPHDAGRCCSAVMLLLLLDDVALLTTVRQPACTLQLQDATTYLPCCMPSHTISLSRKGTHRFDVSACGSRTSWQRNVACRRLCMMHVNRPLHFR